MGTASSATTRSTPQSTPNDSDPIVGFSAQAPIGSAHLHDATLICSADCGRAGHDRAIQNERAAPPDTVIHLDPSLRAASDARCGMIHPFRCRSRTSEPTVFVIPDRTVALLDHEPFGIAGGVAEAHEMGQVRGPIWVGVHPGVFGEPGFVYRADFSAPRQGWSPRYSAPSHTCTGVAA